MPCWTTSCCPLSEDRPTSLPKVKVADNVGKHLLVLAGILVLLAAWGYHLKAYGVLYSTQGPAFGASFTDVNIKVMVYRILMVLSFLMCLFVIYNAFRLKIKLLLICTGIWVGAIVILATGLPVLIQQVVVKPNELAKESPYIAYNIDFTRRAYNLNNIKEVDFEVNNNLTAEDIKNHEATIQNIRVWDERPLLQTYRQIQSIRLYYDFNNVDVDRYMIDSWCSAMANAASIKMAAPTLITDTKLNFEYLTRETMNVLLSYRPTVSIITGNAAPLSNASDDQTVDEGDTVTLSGLASTDPDGNIGGYYWQQTDGVSVTSTILFYL